MTPDDEPDEPDLASIGSELRAQRLGFALRNLAVELVDERRKVAQLRREIADLRARLESLERTHGPTKGRQDECPQGSSASACPLEAASCARHD
jgi:hypothetical protein